MSISILKGLHRRVLGLSKDDQVIAYKGFVSGGEGKPVIVHSSPDTVAVFDDFIGDTGRAIRGNTDPNWRVVDGDTGTDTGSNVVVAPGTSGILRISLGDTPKADARMGITQNLAWKGNQGSIPTDTKNGLRMGARLKAHWTNDTGNNSINVWMGFTDTLDATEIPVIDTGGAIVSPATNAVGIGFASKGGGDTGWVGYAVNGNTDRTPVVLDTGVTMGIYDTLEVEVHHGISDTGGTATFYVNGVAAGSIASPIAMSTALTPTVLVWGDTGGAQYVDVDWINVSAPRDTGL
jgi:hypothetical protein